MSRDEMLTLLSPYLERGEAAAALVPTQDMLDSLSEYLNLLLRWNERMNLTAIRDSREMVTRHFGESLLLARLVPRTWRTVLDLGSGAGFPGLPLQLAYPRIHLTAAESQGKKAAFLREVVRELRLSVEVWGGRAEALVGQRTFDGVAMRAVDAMAAALKTAAQFSAELLVLTSRADLRRWGLVPVCALEVPGTRDSVAALCRVDESAEDRPQAL